jgi:hypothetical protein
VEGGGEWLTLNWYMTLKGTYFYEAGTDGCYFAGIARTWDLHTLQYSRCIKDRVRSKFAHIFKQRINQ